MTLIDEIRAAEAADLESVVNDLAIKVEDGIAIPESTHGGGGKAKYPWKSMAKGQSFFVAGGKLKAFHTLCSSQSKSSNGERKYIARNWDGENGVKGVRVWRTQ